MNKEIEKLEEVIQLYDRITQNVSNTFENIQRSWQGNSAKCFNKKCEHVKDSMLQTRREFETLYTIMLEDLKNL